MTLRIIVVDGPMHVRSLSIGSFQRIWVGRTYYESLPPFARRALIAHECAHLAGHHTEWRALAALVALLCPPLWPLVMRKVCHWQEYRADERAATAGHTHGLLHLLCNDRPASLTHPKNMDRRAKLLHSPHHTSRG